MQAHLEHLPSASRWIRGAIFSKVLDDGRARWVRRVQHRHSAVSTRQDPAIILCVILLLCGDVHLNPGPMTLDACQSADPELPQPTLTSAGFRGNTSANIMSDCNIGQMLTSPVQSRLIPTKPTQAISCLKQQQMKLFQTVNHARVLWDAKTKPKGIFGGHLNIHIIVSSPRLRNLNIY